MSSYEQHFSLLCSFLKGLLGTELSEELTENIKSKKSCLSVSCIYDDGGMLSQSTYFNSVVIKTICIRVVQKHQMQQTALTKKLLCGIKL